MCNPSNIMDSKSIIYGNVDIDKRATLVDPMNSSIIVDLYQYFGIVSNLDLELSYGNLE